MSSSHNTGADARMFVKTPSRWLMASRLLMLVAMCSAGYLAWVSLSDGTVAGCGPESGCAEVLHSRWAYWFGIPVSLPAIGLYVLLLAGSFGLSRQPLGWLAISVMLFMVMGAAIWFVGVQAVILKSFCPFCMIAHSCGFAGALLMWRVADRPSGSYGVWRPAGAALAGLTVLAGGQFLHEPPQFDVHVVGDANPSSKTEASQHELVLHEGRVRLDLNELPVMGSVDAAHVVVSLFDYNCGACRKLHRTWNDVIGQYDGRLAVVNLPLPLSAECNEQVRTRLPVFQTSCDYARLGLAVWRADRAAFKQFDAWVFRQEPLPPLAAARSFAASLLTSNQLTEALADEWIEQTIKTNVEIFAENSRLLNSQKMPQTIFGRAVVIGALNPTNDIPRLIQEHFGIEPAP